jgi:hypothetical protein
VPASAAAGTQLTRPLAAPIVIVAGPLSSVKVSVSPSVSRALAA